MNQKTTRIISAAVLALALFAPSRMLAQIRTLSSHLPAAVAQMTPVGQLSGSTNLQLAIGLPLRNQAALTTLLQQIYDSHSTNYHHYLTPAQFAAQFGPTKQDYDKVVNFAKAHGLKVTATTPNRMLVDIKGSVANIEKALNVTMQIYQSPTENRTFYAPNTAPSLDASLPIADISGLNNYALPHPQFVVKSQMNTGAKANALPNLGSGPNGAYRGLDFRAAYVPGVTLDGTGQTVGLLQFDGYTASDITYYETHAGLPNVPLMNVLLDGFSGAPTGSGGEVEVSLDIEMSISMATNLSKVIVYMAGPVGNWHDILNRMATDNLAKQLSCSWYIPRGAADPVADGIFQEMAAQGQSFYDASGDSDALSGLISFAGDSPYITQVGGTTLSTTGPGGSWSSEKVWNLGNGEGSSGGISTQYSIPSWQTNAITPASQGSTTMRNTPDVSMTADNVYVRADGRDYNVGGTSCAAPLWAGFTALVNQLAVGTGHSPVGFINPLVYSIGSSATYTTVFHDITTGNNERPGSPTEFTAVTGYDLCTGLGTPNGQALINALANPEPLIVTPATGFTSFGSVGGPFTVTSQTLTLTNGGTNSLNWSIVNTSLWLSASSSSGTLAAHGPSTQVTVRFNTATSNLVLGAYSSTVVFSNQSDHVGQGRTFSVNIISPPSITSQPANQAVLEGTPASFQVQIAGGLPLSCRWQFNGTDLADGGNISGSTTTNLVISPVTTNNAGIYTCTVTNYVSSIVSSNATLSIMPSLPVVVTQPASQTILVGQNVQFSVTTVGNSPYFYQWICNTTNISGATNATLALNNVQLSQAGNYSVLVTNLYGSTNSMPAVLTVNPIPPCDPAPSGIASWWSAEGNVNDIIGTNNGTAVGALGYTNGEAGMAFVFDGSTSYIPLPASPSLDIGATGTGITIEAWVLPTAADLASDGGPVIEWDSASAAYLEFWVSQNFYGNIVDTSGISHAISAPPGLLSSSQWQHVALTYDKASGNAYIYLNGATVATNHIGTVTPQTSTPANIGRRTGEPLGNGETYGGLMDEVSIYNRALSQTEIQAIYLTGPGGKCQPQNPPVIASQPVNQTTYVGQNVTFSVSVTGSQPLSYQWSFNNTNILGATNAILALNNIQLSQAGNYSVLVTNLFGSTNSTSALLTVNATSSCDPAPSGIVSWWSAEGTAHDIIGTNNGTAVGALGYTNGEVGMAFVFDGSTSYIPLPASPSLNIGATGTGITIEAWVLPTAADLASDGGPVIEWDSASAAYLEFWVSQNFYGNIVDTSGVSHAISAPTGLLSSSQWQHVALTYDKASGNAYIYLNGATVATNHIGTVTPQTSTPANIGRRTGEPLGNGETYGGLMDEVSIYNRALSQTEIQAIYLIGAGGKCVAQSPPIIVSQPASQTVAVGGTAIFSVSATGTLPLSYQWSFNGTNNPIAGATNATLTLSNVQLSLAGNYAVTVTNFFGSTNSAVAVLTVATPPVITTQPTNQTVAAGATVVFSVTAASTVPLQYQWSFNTTNIDGATNATLVLFNAQFNEAGSYSVSVSNLAGSTNSAAAVLMVTMPPVITTQPAGQTTYVGRNATFSVSVTGSQPLSYQWICNTTNISGATNATLALNNVQLSQAGNYSVLVTNLYGSTNSMPAVLTVNPIPPCDPAPSGIASWWSAEGNVNDIIGTNNGTAVGALGYTNGEVGMAFVFDGSTSYIPLPASPSLNIGATGTGITIEAWVLPTAADLASDGGPVIEWDSASAAYLEFWVSQNFYGNIVDTSGVSHAISAPTGLLSSSQWQHVALTYDKASGNAYIYLNGATVATNHIGTVTPQTSTPANIGRRTGEPLGNGETYGGLMDEVSIYNRALSQTEIQAIYLIGAGGKCVAQSPPIIVSQPASQTVAVGGTAIFSVTATGAVPLQYQWSFNTTNILGGTHATLVLNNVQLSQAGNYSVTVSNIYGATNSTSALLTVNPIPPCDPAPSGIASWWSAEGNVNDIIGTNNGAIQGPVTFGSGEVGLAFVFNGTNTAVRIPASPSLNLGLNNGLTLEAWINPSNAVQPCPICEWNSDGAAYGAAFWIASSGGLYANVLDTSGNNHIFQTANNVLTAGVFQHVALVYSKTTGVATLYCNAVVVAQATLGSFTPQTSYNLYLGQRPGPGDPYTLAGSLDEMSAYNRALSASEIQAIYTAGSAGKCLPEGPQIVSFSWNNIVSPRFVNAPFAVTVSAEDVSNNVITDFTGTVYLTSTNGIPVNPPVSANFIQGVWNGTITIAQPATNLVLRADDGVGHFGLANPVNVIATPMLGEAVDAPFMLMYWQVGPPTFILQSTTNLDNPSWQTVVPGPVVIQGLNFVALPSTDASDFFRLIYQGP